MSPVCRRRSDAIRDVRAAGKPVSAVAHHWAASAAYWLASAADELVVTPSGEVGSIGVYVYHEDISKRLGMLGVTPTLIKAGANKAEGHPAFPLGEEAAGARPGPRRRVLRDVRERRRQGPRRAGLDRP